MTYSMVIALILLAGIVFCLFSVAVKKRKDPSYKKVKLLNIYLQSQSRRLNKLKKTDQQVFYEQLNVVINTTSRVIEELESSNSADLRSQENSASTPLRYEHIRVVSNLIVYFLTLLISTTIVLFHPFMIPPESIWIPSFYDLIVICIISLIIMLLYNYIFYTHLRKKVRKISAPRDVPLDNTIFFHKLWDTKETIGKMLEGAKDFRKYYEPEISSRSLWLIRIARVSVLILVISVVGNTIAGFMEQMELFLIFINLAFIISLIGYFYSFQIIKNQYFENYAFFFLFLGLSCVLSIFYTFNFIILISSILCFLIGGVGSYIFSQNRKFRLQASSKSYKEWISKNLKNLTLLQFLFIDLLVIITFCLNLTKFNLFDFNHWICVIFFIFSIKSFRSYIGSYRDYFDYSVPFKKRRLVYLAVYVALGFYCFSSLLPIIGIFAWCILFTHNLGQLVGGILEGRKDHINYNLEEASVIMDKKAKKEQNDDNAEEKMKQNNEDREKRSNKLIAHVSQKVEANDMEFNSLVKLTDEEENSLFQEIETHLKSKKIPYIDPSEEIQLNKILSLPCLIALHIVKDTKDLLLIDMILIKHADLNTPCSQEGNPIAYCSPELVDEYSALFLSVLESDELLDCINRYLNKRILPKRLLGHSIDFISGVKGQKVKFCVDLLQLTQYPLQASEAPLFSYNSQCNCHMIEKTDLESFFSYLKKKYLFLEGIRRKKKQIKNVGDTRLNSRSILLVASIFSLLFVSITTYLFTDYFLSELMKLMFLFFIICFYWVISTKFYYAKKTLYVPYHLKKPKFNPTIFEAVKDKLPPRTYAQLLYECPYLKSNSTKKSKKPKKTIS